MLKIPFPTKSSNKMSRMVNAPNSAKQLHILKYYVDGLKDEEGFNCLQKAGFLELLSKCAVSADANFDKFSADIHRMCEERKYQKGSREYKAVAQLRKDWRRELEVIRKCIDCYVFWTTSDEDKDFFTLVCSKPHLVVFVNESQDGSPRMWPAKVVSVNNGDKIVSVESFGDYLQAEYPFDECYLYTDTAPKSYSASCKYLMEEKYYRSFQEVKKYIENSEKTFGLFVPATSKVTITDVDRHLTEMYPDFFKRTPAEPADKNSRSKSIGYASQSTSAYHSTRDAVTIKKEQTLGVETGSTRNENRKHKMANASATSPAHHKTNRLSHVSEIGNASQTNDGVIVITDDEEDPVVTENTPDSSQNPNEPSASGKSCQSMLDEFCNVTRTIHKFETQLNHLMEQESCIRAKFNEPTIANVDGKLDELGEVTKKILECEEQLRRQKDEEKTVIAKIKNSKKTTLAA